MASLGNSTAQTPLSAEISVLYVKRGIRSRLLITQEDSMSMKKTNTPLPPTRVMTHEERLELISRPFPTINVISGKQWAGTGVTDEDGIHRYHTPSGYNFADQFNP